MAFNISVIKQYIIKNTINHYGYNRINERSIKTDS